MLGRGTGKDWEINGLWNTTSLGGEIGLHGIANPDPKSPTYESEILKIIKGEDPRLERFLKTDWTDGCIYLRNQDINEIRAIIFSTEMTSVPILILKSAEEIAADPLKKNFEAFLKDPEPFIDLGSIKGIEIPEEFEHLFDKTFAALDKLNGQLN